MPVLTCPFAAIPAQEIPQALIAYPASFTIPTELTIKPVAGETWSTEGLSLQFVVKYLQQYYVNVSGSNEALVASKKFLKESQKYLVAQQKYVELQIEQLEKHFSKEPNEVTDAEIQAAAASREGIKHELEGVLHELETLNKEISELGRVVALENIKTPQLKIIARLYARGNELVWNEELEGVRFFVPKGFTRSGTGEYSTAFGEIVETFNTHTQYNDPIDFTERENFKLTFEFAAPPLPTGHEGPEVGKNELAARVSLSEVQAVVNYSSSH